MKKVCVCLVLSLLCFCLQIKANELTNLPLDHQAYDFLKRLTVKGLIKERLDTSLPLTRGEVAKALIEVKRKHLAGKINLTQIELSNLERFLGLFGDEIQIFAPELSVKKRKHFLSFDGKSYSVDFDSKLTQEVVTSSSAEVERKNTSISSVDFGLNAKLGSHIGVYDILHARILLGSSSYNPYRTEVSNYLTDDSNTLNSMEAYVVLSLPYLSIQWGIDEFWWGPGRHGAMLLSNNSPPTDTLKFSGLYPPFKFTYFTAILESHNKYLSGHRLEITPCQGIDIGLSDIVVFGERYELRFANPFIVYFILEPEMEDSQSNVLLGLDVDVTLLRNLEIYAECLIDDFQPSEGWDALKVWHSKYGLLVGGSWLDPFGWRDTDLELEYAFINQYAYTHKYPIARYTHKGFSIGHWMGNDADDFWVNLKHWFTTEICAGVSYELERHGETDVTDGSDYDLLQSEDTEWEFLSGITESTHSIGVSTSYNLIGRYLVDLKYTHSWIENVDHRDGVDDTKDQVLLSGQYRF